MLRVQQDRKLRRYGYDVRCKMGFGVCVLLMCVCECHADGGMGGVNEQWYVMRRRCENELYAAALIATTMGTQVVSAWVDSKASACQDVKVMRSGNKEAYVGLSRVIQFMSGIQEATFIAIDTKNKCRLCDANN